MGKVSLVFLLLLVILGCGKPEFTIVSDPVWIQEWQGEEGMGLLVKTLEKQTGKKISFMPGEIAGERIYIEEILSRMRGETAIFSPLLSAAVDPQLAENAGKKVILSGFIPRKEETFSASILLSRKNAYLEAGEACARMLEEEPDVYGNIAAAVFYTAVPRRREEMIQFKAGFTTIKGADSLKIFEITGVDDRRSVKPFLEEVKRANIQLVLLSAAGLNSFCLEECAKEGRYAILEEGSGFEAFQENVRGSIEINKIGLLRTAVSIPFDSLSGTVVEANLSKNSCA